MPETKKNKAMRLAGELLLVALLIALDLVTKHLAQVRLEGQSAFPLWAGVLEFVYIRNTGAAFSILQNATPLLTVVSILVSAALLILLLRVVPIMDRRFLPLRLCLCFLLAGAAGNLVDRLWLGFVRDFIYFVPIDFPVFNVADIYVTVSAVVLAALMIFVYRDEDLEKLAWKKKQGS